MKISDIETPALILEKSVFENNIAEMKKILDGSKLSLRPHYKSHKCSQIARIQIENGAVGMTCAKLSEAYDLVDSGIEDVLIANQIVGDEKISRLASLAKKCRLTVCVDNEENVADISRAAESVGALVRCLVEYEIGMERCGVTDSESVLKLAKYIDSCPNLKFEGIQAYAGHISHMEDSEERMRATAENYEKIRSLVAYLSDNGVTVNTISGGSTGTGSIKASSGLYTELQAGSYIFMDATYRNLDLPFKNSLFLLTSVVSCREGLVVLDSGVKTCGVDQGNPVPMGFEAERIVASEEHFQIHNPTVNFEIGQKVRLIPAHCCSTVNLHDKIYLVDGDKVVNRILVTARGIGK